ncbi:MAG: hypothetical protein NVSMB25_14880 [Thermoleophilaceae bacterium]
MRAHPLTRLLAASLAALGLLALAPPAQGASIFGFNDDWSPANVDHAVRVSRQFHPNSARVVLYWSSIQPRRGVSDWYLPDRAYQAMVARGIRPLFDVVSAPRWTTARGCRSIYTCQQTPAHDGDFRNFLRDLTRRYPRAIGIEVGQEPNLRNWSAHPDPARYAQILKAGWLGVKSANRHMRVVMGSTCCNSAHGNGNIGAATFLSRLYRYGAKGHYDAIGYHIYPGGPVSRVAADLRSELYGFRGVRDANRDRSPIWVTETGFPSRGRSRYGGGTFTERNQADRESIAYRTLNASRDVQALFMFRLIDPKPSYGVGLDEGIFRINYRAKLSALALKQLTRTRH